MALIASLTVTAKLVELPTTDRFPFASAFSITEASTLAVPVTVSVDASVILQLVPDVPVFPPLTMVRVCALTMLLNTNNMATKKLLYVVNFIRFYFKILKK
ncbi:hypothetical protein [Flavobacterium sp. W22_SRS_FP1]|uniref:hypothetical protein n=1 Tax=Flavobacterium sp. W22_SRS_FP1 TaxID=3240276 RepID=UPI003F92A260